MQVASYNVCRLGERKLRDRLTVLERKYGRRIWCLQESQKIGNHFTVDGYVSYGELEESTCILVPVGMSRKICGCSRESNCCAVLFERGLAVVSAYVADSGKSMDVFDFQ